MKVFVIYSFLLLLVTAGTLGAIPSDIELCSAGDEKCIAQKITEVANANPHGRKDLNLPDLEPLKINQLVIGQSGGSSNGFNLDLVLKDVDMTGLSTIKIDRAVGFGADPTTSKFEIYARIPVLHLKGKYKANGRILVLPIQGEGPCDFILDSTKISIKIKPKSVMKNGKHHISIEKLKLLLEPEKLTIKLENLFGGDPALGENLNNFLNDNWRDVWSELGPAINDGMGEIIRQIISNVFKISPYNDVFKSN